MTYGARIVIWFAVFFVLSFHGKIAVSADYLEAKKFLRAGAFHQAYNQFSTLAEQGDSSAQFQLGLMAHLGNGIPQNFLDAGKWYKRAAISGDANSQNNLGILYRDGLGTAPNAIIAYKWFSLAAAQRNEKAINNLRMLRHNLDKAEIANGQKLAQQHYDMVKLSRKNNRLVPVTPKTTANSTEAQTPKLQVSKIRQENVTPDTTDIELPIFEILKTIFEAIEQPTNEERKKGTPAEIHKSDST